jgi:hypothetical protein
MSIRISDPIFAPYVIDYDHKGYSIKDSSDSKPDRVLVVIPDLGQAIGYISTNLLLNEYGGGTMTLSEFISTQETLQREIHNALMPPKPVENDLNTPDSEISSIQGESQEAANIQQA